MDDLAVILKDTYTLSSLKLRLRILRAHFSKIFFGASDLTLDENDSAWLQSLPKDFLAKFDKDNLTYRISRLENSIKELQFLTLYLSFEANEETEGLIGSMTRQLFRSQIVLDIKYDPALLAGCALSWKGVYRDYSLRAKIEGKKEEVLQSFRKYLR